MTFSHANRCRHRFCVHTNRLCVFSACTVTYIVSDKCSCLLEEKKQRADSTFTHNTMKVATLTSQRAFAYRIHIGNQHAEERKLHTNTEWRSENIKRNEIIIILAA